MSQSSAVSCIVPPQFLQPLASERCIRAVAAGSVVAQIDRPLASSTLSETVQIKKADVVHFHGPFFLSCRQRYRASATGSSWRGSHEACQTADDDVSDDTSIGSYYYLPAAYAAGNASRLRVLDLSGFPPGAFCTVTLADMGADVLRVEPIRRANQPVRSGGHWSGQREEGVI